MNKTARYWLWALVIAAACLAAAKAQTEERTEAKRHFDAGLVFFEAESYSAAAVEFEASVDLFPTRMGFFNLANCLKALLRFDEALDVIERMERELGDQLDRKWKAELAAFVDDLRKLGGELTVRTSPDSATVTIGGRRVGTTPLARPVLLASGEHRVEVTKAGYEPESRTVRMTSRGSETIDLTLVIEKPTEPVPPDTVSPEPVPAIEQPDAPAEAGRVPGLFWAGAGLAVVSGVVSGVMYGIASSRAGDYDSTKKEYEALSPSSASYAVDEARLWDDAEGAREDVERYSMIGLGAAITAGAFAAAAVVVLVVGGDGRDEKSAVALRPAGAGIALEF